MLPSACLACKTEINDPEEIFEKDLKVAETERELNYLIGLSPLTVSTMARRSADFYCYQVTQELEWRRVIAKEKDEVLHETEQDLEKFKLEHEQRIKTMKKRISDLEESGKHEAQRFHQLQERLNEKNAQYERLQVYYDDLKRKVTSLQNLR